MTSLITAGLISDTPLRTWRPATKGRVAWRSSTWVRGRAPGGGLGHGHREARRRSAPAPDAHNARTTWLATLNEDGSPHVTAVGALWLDGTFWFQTGAGTRKASNVARDARCSISSSIRDADVVVEGDAARATDPALVARVAKAWADTGWPAEPDASG